MDSRRTAICQSIGAAGFTFVRGRYAGLLGAIRDGRLSGAIVRDPDERELLSPVFDHKGKSRGSTAPTHRLRKVVTNLLRTASLRVVRMRPAQGEESQMITRRQAGLLGCLMGLAGGVLAAPVRTPVEGPFADRLREVARNYRSFRRVDDVARWAPLMCLPPPPGMTQMSESRDEKTHGRKLYFLFARDAEAYISGLHKPSPVGQAIVKEAWVPEEVKDPAKPGAFDRTKPFAGSGGKFYCAVQQADLFVMIKLDPATPGTDQGWIYGTLRADGKTVTSAGRVASCMKCHQRREQRLFGPADTLRRRG